jgi:spermidine synthase
MEPRILIDEARTPDGRTITLTSRSGYFTVSVDGDPLMGSAEHHSEERMAELACADLTDRSAPRVLVGGLGMGYTLRAVLDRLPPRSEVIVAELLEAVVSWNRGPLAALANRPLTDRRVRLEVGDLVDYLAARPAPFDAVLLDVDNGPEAFTTESNSRLYDRRGLRRLHAALRPGGVLIVWSAFESPRFARALRRAGLEAEVVRSRARERKGARHTLYVGRRRSDDL